MSFPARSDDLPPIRRPRSSRLKLLLQPAVIESRDLGRQRRSAFSRATVRPVAVPRRLLGALVLGALTLFATFPPGAPALDGPQITRSLERSMDSARTRSLSAQVRDLTTGETIYAREAAADRIPASLAKLFTTAAALQRLGTQARLVTRVVRDAPLEGRRLVGDLILVGAGDPTLDRAAIGRLAGAVQRAGISRVTGSVLGDESRFDARRGGPRTGGAYDRDIGGVLGALTVGRGFSRRPGGPALAAARALARELRARGVWVGGRTDTGVAPAAVSVVARSQSPRIGELVRRMNQPSDNFYAETLLKDLGLVGAGRGTTDAGLSIVRDELSHLNVSPTLADGSGLSRANRTSAAEVVDLISAMRSTPNAATFESSLAVVGRSGTLRRRLRGTHAAGACSGKTGTLNRVSTLAGLCVTRAGHTLAFAFLLNDVALWRGRSAQDRAMRAIVAYRSPLPSSASAPVSARRSPGAPAALPRR